MNSEIGQSRSRRLTISIDDQSLEDRLDAALKISPNLTPEFDDDDHELEGRISDFPQGDGGKYDIIKTDDVTDHKTTSVSAPSSSSSLIETPNISTSSSLPSTLGQLDAASDDDNDGFKTPTDAAHRIPPPTECPPAPKIKKRPNSPAVNSAVRPIRRCRRKLLFDNGFDLMGGLKINKERLPR